MDIRSHIEDMLENEIFDYYTYTAYEQLINKTESFYKVPQIEKLTKFLHGNDIETITVIGHSCKIDFPYFQLLNEKFPNSKWLFNPYDFSTKTKILKMIKDIGIKNYAID